MYKPLRIRVHDKYDGHCAYCGKSIEYIDMQVDHIDPHHLNPKRNDFNNLNPSCRRCNHYKRALSLEDFRKIWLGKLHERLAKQYKVKVALDYGIITLKPFDGKFYFEKQEQNDEH